jgi:hypothetical protein
VAINSRMASFASSTVDMIHLMMLG